MTTSLNDFVASTPLARVLMRPLLVARSQAMSPTTSVSLISKAISSFRVANTCRYAARRASVPAAAGRLSRMKTPSDV